MRRLLPVLLFLPLASFAQEAPPPPPLPEGYESTPPPEQDVLEPQVTIIRRERETIEEYAIAGRRYMVKITPRLGPPYYLIDSDGDGSLETRRNELDNFELPRWVLLRW